MDKIEAVMDGMQESFFNKYSVSQGQRIHFDNTGKFQDKRLNDEYNGFWFGWATKADQIIKSRDEEINSLRDSLEEIWNKSKEVKIRRIANKALKTGQQEESDV